MENIIQGTPEWFAMRLGKITASKIADVMSKGKAGAESAGVRNYRMQLVCERMTGMVEETFTSVAMQRGTDLEPMARSCYEFVTGNHVEQIAFVNHPYIENGGCSPDGLINDEGLVEIKCPNTGTHVDYLIKNEPPSDYMKQMQWQMACTGRQYCDFVSYDPRLPEELQLFIVRVTRDNAAIEEMEQAVFSFDLSIERMISDLKALSAQKAA